MSDNTPVSREFKLPEFFPTGPLSLAVVANGISSDPVSFTGPVYVEFGYGGFQFGTIDFPYATLTQGVANGL